MKTIALASILAIAACAPVVWDRPMTTSDQFRIDNARCQLTANSITPSEYVRNIGDAVAEGISVGIDRAENFNLCMVANGYQRRAMR